ncbi:hypothetical protein NDU88_002914 [Pleurodeles waltl]|uniref:Uncharacterized protein n=1 Tax=Pleurodeles waltl TaxID=8319 RepID=A0AAV7TPN0_PLEWA|nr:hypothetical protein NDU88_002914 [Pleurodeles waltl]
MKGEGRDQRAKKAQGPTSALVFALLELSDMEEEQDLRERKESVEDEVDGQFFSVNLPGKEYGKPTQAEHVHVTGAGDMHVPEAECEGLKTMQQWDEIRIKEADKGGNIVIMTTLAYEREMYAQLADQVCYERITRNPIFELTSTINKSLKDWFESSDRNDHKMSSSRGCFQGDGSDA